MSLIIGEDQDVIVHTALSREVFPRVFRGNPEGCSAKMLFHNILCASQSALLGTE